MEQHLYEKLMRALNPESYNKHHKEAGLFKNTAYGTPNSRIRIRSRKQANPRSKVARAKRKALRLQQRASRRANR